MNMEFFSNKPMSQDSSIFFEKKINKKLPLPMAGSIYL